MSIQDEYEAIYRRIEDFAGIDRTPRLLAQINALGLSDYDRRLELLVDIGYEPAKYPFWGNLEVFSLCEWTNLLIGIEPMEPDVQFPNLDNFDVLIKTVDAWLHMHRLVGDKLLDTTAEKERAAIAKRGRDPFSNDSYRKGNLIAATTAASIPLPPLIDIGGEHVSSSKAISPRWLFRKLPDGRWEIGDESAPSILEPVTKGFDDIAHIIQTDGTSPLLLPGSRSAASEELPSSLPTTPESGVSTGGDGGTWTGFGSDDIANRQARVQYKQARQKLMDDIEAANETGNIDRSSTLSSQLAELESYMADTTRPGGHSRKLSGGDPVEKAAAAARDRKSTAIQKLMDAGLDDMATHIKHSYRTGKREIAYIKGRPYPEWILE